MWSSLSSRLWSWGRAARGAPGAAQVSRGQQGERAGQVVRFGSELVEQHGSGLGNDKYEVMEKVFVAALECGGQDGPCDAQGPAGKV